MCEQHQMLSCHRPCVSLDLRYVTAHGTGVSAPAVASFVQELRSQQLQLPQGSYLPGSLLADSSASSSNSPTGSPR